jgi:hypothetical protein
MDELSELTTVGEVAAAFARSPRDDLLERADLDLQATP